MADILKFPDQSERIRRHLDRPIRTAWDIGEEAAAKRGRKPRPFGSAVDPGRRIPPLPPITIRPLKPRNDPPDAA